MEKSMQDQLRKMQLKELEILKEIHKVCEEQKISYMILGGTMIGAIRHKGFIPWDDDIDIGIPRPYYEIFIRRAKEWLPNHLCCNSMVTEKNYKYEYAKVCDLTTTILEKNGVLGGVFVDVFPIDGFGDSMKKASETFIQYKKQRRLYNLLVEDNRKRSLIKRIVVFILRIILKNKDKKRRVLYKIARKHEFYDSKYVGVLVGACDIREVMEKRVYTDKQLYEFEGNDFYGPKDYDFYLTQRYGDYMKMPPENQRVGHMNAYVNLELPYKDFNQSMVGDKNVEW